MNLPISKQNISELLVLDKQHRSSRIRRIVISPHILDIPPAERILGQGSEPIEIERLGIDDGPLCENLCTLRVCQHATSQRRQHNGAREVAERRDEVVAARV